MLEGPVQFLFYFLLQEAGGFCLLHSGSGGLEAAVVAGRVALVHLRAVLLVHADHNHTCRSYGHAPAFTPGRSFKGSKTRRDAGRQLTAAQRSHLCVLRVDLRDVGDPLAQHVHWDLVTVLVLPVGRLVASSLDLRPAVSCREATTTKHDSLPVSL